jgi:hypothetical protein
MHSHILFALDVARERQDRAVEQGSIDQRLGRSRLSIRGSLGRRVIALGERIAAEPSLELARSR